MADLSNPTGRVLDIITFLARHPTEDFSLADIASGTGMSKASAHRVLLTLTGADFLERHARRKTYSLGMGLVAVGQAALEKYRGVDAARDAMARLTGELKVQCSATGLIGGDLLILARDGLPQSHEGLNRVGERRPMIPPMGMCHAAWGSPAVVEPYLAFAREHMQPEVYTWLVEALALIRQRGFAIASVTWRRLGDVAILPAGRGRQDAQWPAMEALVGELNCDEVQLGDVDDSNARKIGQIAAPVFASDGTVAFQLVLSGLPTTLNQRRLEPYIDRLLAAAATVTNQINGSVPRLRTAK